MMDSMEKRTDTELTLKQKAYVAARAKGANVVTAGSLAGFAIPDVQSYKIEKIPKVAAALAKERAKAEKMSDMSKKKVMDGFIEAIEQAKMLADPGSQIQGWKEIARMCGYYEPTKVQVEVSVSAKRLFSKFEVLSDEELLRLAETEIIDAEYEVTDDEDPRLLSGPG
jgi:phage terminase small subunit